MEIPEPQALADSLGGALWKLDKAVEQVLLADAAGTPPPLHALDELRGKIWASYDPAGNYLKWRSRTEKVGEDAISKMIIEPKLAHEVGLPAKPAPGQKLFHTWRYIFRHRYGGNVPAWENLDEREQGMWAEVEKLT